MSPSEAHIPEILENNAIGKIKTLKCLKQKIKMTYPIKLFKKSKITTVVLRYIFVLRIFLS